MINISEDIYKSFYHTVVLEVSRAYQIIPDELFISKKPCIGKPIDKFLDSWEKELENTRVNLREVSAPNPLSSPYMRQLKKFVQEATLKQIKLTISW